MGGDQPVATIFKLEEKMSRNRISDEQKASIRDVMAQLQ